MFWENAAILRLQKGLYCFIFDETFVKEIFTSYNMEMILELYTIKKNRRFPFCEKAYKIA